MTLKWRGDRVKKSLERAQIDGVNSTMAAAVLHAKANHGAGAHGSRRFETDTGALERSLRIVRPARASAFGGVRGRWGSVGLAYARRIELGFQGKDSAGRIVNAQDFPFMIPAAQAEYPKLAQRIRRAL